jgi:glycosyltransferase 2 family protein
MDKKKSWNIIKLFLKISFTVAALWIVYTKIDFKKLSAIKQETNLWFLAPAVFFFILSQFVSSFRLMNFFKNISLPITVRQNLRLYLLGMFYNLFLPGGIGGDGYKILTLKRRFDTTHKKLFGAIFFDRLSGLWALCLIIVVLSGFIPMVKDYFYWIISGYAAGTFIYYLAMRRYFPLHVHHFIPSHLLAILVQSFQLCSAVCILAALGHDGLFIPYLFIFMMSSFATLFPFSVGGLGIREIASQWGASAISLDKDLSVLLSLGFYLTSALVALTAVFILFDKKRFPAEVKNADKI